MAVAEAAAPPRARPGLEGWLSGAAAALPAVAARSAATRATAVQVGARRHTGRRMQRVCVCGDGERAGVCVCEKEGKPCPDLEVEKKEKKNYTHALSLASRQSRTLTHSHTRKSTRGVGKAAPPCFSHSLALACTHSLSLTPTKKNNMRPQPL